MKRRTYFSLIVGTAQFCSFHIEILARGGGGRGEAEAADAAVEVGRRRWRHARWRRVLAVGGCSACRTSSAATKSPAAARPGGGRSRPATGRRRRDRAVDRRAAPDPAAAGQSQAARPGADSAREPPDRAAPWWWNRSRWCTARWRFAQRRAGGARPGAGGAGGNFAGGRPTAGQLNNFPRHRPRNGACHRSRRCGRRVAPDAPAARQPTSCNKALIFAVAGWRRGFGRRCAGAGMGIASQLPAGGANRPGVGAETSRCWQPNRESDRRQWPPWQRPGPPRKSQTSDDLELPISGRPGHSRRRPSRNSRPGPAGHARCRPARHTGQQLGPESTRAHRKPRRAAGQPQSAPRRNPQSISAKQSRQFLGAISRLERVGDHVPVCLGDVGLGGKLVRLWRRAISL